MARSRLRAPEKRNSPITTTSTATFAPPSGRVAAVGFDRFLLWCGVAASLLYVAMNVIAPLSYPGYDVGSQTVSELSAIGAPTRPLWVFLGAGYTALSIAFGVGVYRAGGKVRALRVAGRLLAAYGAIGIFWPPMHLRGTQPSLTDTLHIVWTIAAVGLMAGALCFGSAGFGVRFKFYSYSTLIVLLVFGLLTSREAPAIPVNGPTPLIGVWERTNIGVFLLWVIVLSTLLLRRPDGSLTEVPEQ